jgi:hypothetical protein
MNLGSMTKKATKQKDPREIRIELRAEIAALEDERVAHWATASDAYRRARHELELAGE